MALLKQVNSIFCTDVTVKVKATTGNSFVYAVTKLFLSSINLFDSYMVVLKILALILTAIILVPSGAHLFELPGKISPDREAYFIIQGIYYGWALFAIPIFAAILANGALFFMLRRDNFKSACWALTSCFLITISLAVFFTWIFPANEATVNWTIVPENWESLRLDWEYGHAANAIIVFFAFIASTLATVRRI